MLLLFYFLEKFVSLGNSLVSLVYLCYLTGVFWSDIACGPIEVHYWLLNGHFRRHVTSLLL